jgi:hypothetical protein
LLEFVISEELDGVKVQFTIIYSEEIAKEKYNNWLFPTEQEWEKFFYDELN